MTRKGVLRTPQISRNVFLSSDAIKFNSQDTPTCGVMIYAMYCGIVVIGFELELRYYVHFQINALGKGMDPLILLAMG